MPRRAGGWAAARLVVSFSPVAADRQEGAPSSCPWPSVLWRDVLKTIHSIRFLSEKRGSKSLRCCCRRPVAAALYICVPAVAPLCPSLQDEGALQSPSVVVARARTRSRPRSTPPSDHLGSALSRQIRALEREREAKRRKQAWKQRDVNASSSPVSARARASGQPPMFLSYCCFAVRAISSLRACRCCDGRRGAVVTPLSPSTSFRPQTYITLTPPRRPRLRQHTLLL